jgi:hypothetical protein
MELLKLLGTALVSVSGVIAGLSAVLYALGFAATAVHQRMLGVGWGVIARDPFWYLGAGGQVFLGWIFIAMVAFFIVVFFADLASCSIDRIKRGRGRISLQMRRAFGWLDRYVVWLIAIMAMVMTGLLHDLLAQPMSVRDLVLQDPQATCDATGFATAITGSDQAALTKRANKVAFLSALVIAVGAYAIPNLIQSGGRSLPLLICLAAGINAVGAVPVAHGIMRVETRWHGLSGDGALEGFEQGSLRLLGRTPDGVWAWNSAKRSVHLFAIGSFEQLDIGPSESIKQILNCNEINPKADQPKEISDDGSL